MSTQTTNSDSDNKTPETYTRLQELSRGDRVTINDIDYYVVIQNTGMRSLFGPDFPTLITPNGKTKDLAFGKLSEDSDECGVVWLDDIPENPENSNLLAGYDSVHITECDAETVYDQLKHTTEKVCPHCGNDVAQFKHGSRDGRDTRELLKCNDKECREYYVRQRTLPTETVTATVQTFDDEIKEVELSGAYREVITSRFKMDPRQRAKESWVTARELADTLENKTTGESTHGRIGYSWNDNLQWKDDKYNHKMEIEYKPVRFE